MELLLFCGERGIRTPGTSQFNGFQDRRNRPLCHLSSNAGAKVLLFFDMTKFFIKKRLPKQSFFVSLFVELDPTNVAEVHTVRQKRVVWIHTQTKLHTTCICQLIFGLEEEVTSLCLHQLQWLNLIQFLVVVS